MSTDARAVVLLVKKTFIIAEKSIFMLLLALLLHIEMQILGNKRSSESGYQMDKVREKIPRTKTK